MHIGPGVTEVEELGELVDELELELAKTQKALIETQLRLAIAVKVNAILADLTLAV